MIIYFPAVVNLAAIEAFSHEGNVENQNTCSFILSPSGKLRLQTYGESMDIKTDNTVKCRFC